MINWISSQDENNIRKVNYERLKKIMEFLNSRSTTDEMVNYVKILYEEYKTVLSQNPETFKDNLFNSGIDDFVIDGELSDSDVIISPSDLNSYFTIKKLNENKADLTVVCFDMHSDTYDYNDFLWKGNSFSMLMKEGYIKHYIVIGVPKEKREMCMEDTNEDLRARTHLIDPSELFELLASLNPSNVFVSIDADCLNCREAKYTAVEYSPSTILNYVSHLDTISDDDYIQKIKECIHVKNALGYSNYYHTGENSLTYHDIIKIVEHLNMFCEANNINLGVNSNSPYYQIMEVSGYDYGGLTTEMVVELIKGLDLKEVRYSGKESIIKKIRKNG